MDNQFIGFRVEVIDDLMMKMVIDNVPEAGMTTTFTATFENFLALAEVIQKKATLGFTCGHA